MLRKMLQGFGLTVDTVESGEEALNYLRSQRPDAVFMDHTMPGMDGLMAVRRMHADPEIATIPVAMYTSKDEPAYRSEAYAAGAIDVLTKPAVPDVLSAMLERISALIDAPPPPVEAQKAVSESTSVSGSVSAEWVEKLAFEKAEMVVYNAIESQVLPLINDVVAKLRRDIESNQESIAARICEARLATWQPPPGASATPSAAAFQAQLHPLLEARLETFQRDGQADTEKRVREMAAEICQGQLHELSERLVRQLSLRFTETSHKVVATAREAAQEAASRAIAEATIPATVLEHSAHGVWTEQNATAAAEQAAQRVWAEVQKSLRQRIYLAAGWAAAVGVGAAALAYGLLR